MRDILAQNLLLSLIGQRVPSCMGCRSSPVGCPTVAMRRSRLVNEMTSDPLVVCQI